MFRILVVYGTTEGHTAKVAAGSLVRLVRWSAVFRPRPIPWDPTVTS